MVPAKNKHSNFAYKTRNCKLSVLNKMKLISELMFGSFEKLPKKTNKLENQ